MVLSVLCTKTMCPFWERLVIDSLYSAGILIWLKSRRMIGFSKKPYLLSKRYGYFFFLELIVGGIIDHGCVLVKMILMLIYVHSLKRIMYVMDILLRG